MKENQTSVSVMDAQRMTSLEIAQVTGKMHKDVMKAIRNMEPAWEQERRRKFALMQIREEGIQFYNGGRYKLTPKYEGRGLAQDRAFHYYTLDGEKKQRMYLVWTQLGCELIGSIIIG